MVIGAECQDLLDSLVQNKAAQDEVARVLSKHLSSTDHDPSQTLTPQEIISAFISRFGRSLNPDDAQYLRGLLDVSPTEADQTSEFFNADKSPSSYSPQEKALDLAGEDYELEKKFRSGGMGVFYKAYHRSVRRTVAPINDGYNRFFDVEFQAQMNILSR